jgi:hypothetical protein
VLANSSSSSRWEPQLLLQCLQRDVVRCVHTDRSYSPYCDIAKSLAGEQSARGGPGTRGGGGCLYQQRVCVCVRVHVCERERECECGRVQVTCRDVTMTTAALSSRRDRATESAACIVTPAVSPSPPVTLSSQQLVCQR